MELKPCDLPKKKFVTRNAAKAKALALSDLFDKEYEVYLCPHCKFWHLTKKKLKK